MTKLMNQDACLGCHDDEDDDAAECASADEDDDDDAARCAFADDMTGFSLKPLKCEITTGSDSDVGVGGHIIVNRNNNDDSDNGNHNTSITSANGRVGTVERSESEDGIHVGSSSVRPCNKSVRFDVDVPKSIAGTTTDMKRQRQMTTTESDDNAA